MTHLEPVLGCADLDADLRFFLDELGASIELVRPADDPREYVVAVGESRVRLRRAEHDQPVPIRIVGRREGSLVAPNGSPVELVVDDHTVVVPDAVPSLTVSSPGGVGDFGVGRAGMTYRDLVPDRWGGRFIASHIRVDHDAGEGEIADWVHFHRIRFQMIYVSAGWVDVVYEDQGEPFRMHAGDCVLQPPEIRHRVLRSSTGLEVIEVGCPAEHDTVADHSLTLPTATVDVDRDFGGQRFVRHVAADAEPVAWPKGAADSQWRARDTGIGRATGGLADAVVVTPRADGARFVHDGEFLLLVGVRGVGSVIVDDRRVELGPGGSIAIPAGIAFGWDEVRPDHEALIVSLPAAAVVAA